MENASKALIIAGAILISILLISVGIIVINAMNDPLSEVDRTGQTTAVQTFNSNFDAFVGNDIDYNTAKQCITTVKASNGTNSDREITFKNISAVSGLKRDKTYTIEFNDESSTASDADGYYSECVITQNP